MTPVAIELLTRPPQSPGEPQVGAPSELAPDAVEYIADSDNLLIGCSCSASDSQPY
jgi:hypothetical protein